LVSFGQGPVRGKPTTQMWCQPSTSDSEFIAGYRTADAERGSNAPRRWSGTRERGCDELLDAVRTGRVLQSVRTRAGNYAAGGPGLPSNSTLQPLNPRERGYEDDLVQISRSQWLQSERTRLRPKLDVLEASGRPSIRARGYDMKRAACLSPTCLQSARFAGTTLRPVPIAAFRPKPSIRASAGKHDLLELLLALAVILQSARERGVQQVSLGLADWPVPSIRTNGYDR